MKGERAGSLGGKERVKGIEKEDVKGEGYSVGFHAN